MKKYIWIIMWGFMLCSCNQQSLHGIDVSHWNGNILEDLPKKDNIRFAICKSTQGERAVDPDFSKNWNFLSRIGKMKGAYHFYVYPEDPARQAEHFCHTVGSIKKEDFPLIIDVEELSLPKRRIDRKELQKDVLKFLKHVENKTGRTPIIYSDYSFINQYLNHEGFAKYPLWLAEYSQSVKPRIPAVWKENGCLIWQKTDSYHIDSEYTDFDIYYGNQ